MRTNRAALTFLPVILAIVILSIPVASAYTASSSNYLIMTDSVNTGGLLSTSPSYRVEDTFGESGVGTSSSATYQIKAGYQQMQQTYLAITVSGNISLLPDIPATIGGVADGFGLWTVTTDNSAGYTMNIRASSSPALVSGANNFPDYIPAGVDPDFTFTTPAAGAYFGFTPEGADIVQKYKDGGGVCNIGVLDTASACWAPLTVAPETIVTRLTPNHPSGTQTTIRFRAESGALNAQPPGNYTATTTLTVLAL